MVMSPDQLAVAYQPIVMAAARKYAGIIELDDAIGYGQLGLAKAALSWTEDSNFAFATHAKRQICNAIVDGIRAQKGRSKGGQLGCKSAWPIYFSAIPEDHLAGLLVSDDEDQSARNQLFDALHAAMGVLSADQLRALQLHFGAGETFKGTAQQLGCTESWAVQLCRSALRILRDQLTQQGYGAESMG
jgi:RNA polymerase sigma factor (sigma-70 family)